MKAGRALLRSICSLRSMIVEMHAKGLELGRITKTSAILLSVGVTCNSIPNELVSRCYREQEQDGGWKGIVDTMWNLYFLRQISVSPDTDIICRAIEYLNSNINKHGLWGRSRRDMSRIPVSGMILTLLPELATGERLNLLEKLWLSEMRSLTYKAAYVLMAFDKAKYVPYTGGLVSETVNWLLSNQREDGGFSPWREHPVESNVFCTGVAIVGLSKYCDVLMKPALNSALKWLVSNQLPHGLWPYHEIEDGSSWGCWSLHELINIIGSDDDEI